MNHSYIHGDTVVLTWEPPLNTGGKKIEFYTLYVKTAPKLSGHCIDEDCIATNTEIIVSGLERCYEYTFIVQAFNCRGEGPASSTQVKTEGQLLQNVSVFSPKYFWCFIS